MTWRIEHGDCIEVMRGMPDASVDAVVTDPPYGLAFMGKRWDYDVPAVEVWRECLRVLKPGGHLLAFAGTRTQHRMCCRIEDAGFEIRDMIAWVYGSGFPKSLDVSKAIDKAAGAEREIVGSNPWTNSKMSAGNGVSDLRQAGGYAGEYEGDRVASTITAPATDAARQWQGWGTALKPAMEPITVARKPLVGTVAENVLAHGTGAINVDGCRVGWVSDADKEAGRPASFARAHEGFGDAFRIADRSHRDPTEEQSSLGRWPANLIHDGSDEVVALFPATASGVMKSGTRRAAQDGPGSVCFGTYGGNATAVDTPGDSGSAARFFYCAKADAADRGKGNRHPTVKPTMLMRYLCRLVTPPGGTVLDPFCGSGSTGKAAIVEGFNFIGIEQDAESVAVARQRVPSAAPLFAGIEP